MSIVKYESLEKKLISIDKELVILDKDVAALYGVEPKKLRQQLKRNLEKFPESYAFQLNDSQMNLMVSQNVTPSKQSFGGTNPWVFTEKGLYMVATILKSKLATEATISIIETFAKLRELNRNINAITKTEDETLQNKLAQQSSKLLEEIIEIEDYLLNEDGEIVETHTKFEFNLGFAKVVKSVKKVKS